jgi:arsenate reductase-like glutaredoxin family protein
VSLRRPQNRSIERLLLEVQVFGIKNSPDTRKALRFFAERRIKTHFVDLKERPASPGELRRFVQRFRIEGILDPTSRRFAELGLGTAQLSEERWLDKLAAEPLLLRMPLVRYGPKLTVGDAASTWREWTGR